MPGRDFDGHTVYRLSYLPFDWDAIAEERGKAVRHEDNLVGCGGLMRNGSDPHMSDQSTYRHDYKYNPVAKIGAMNPRDNLGLSDDPMSDTTIMRASYMPIDSYERAESCKPLNVYTPPTTPFHKHTIYNLSYLPYETPEREEYEWCKRRPYEKPTVPFETHTIYNKSYLPPGEYIYVEAEDGDEDEDSEDICNCCREENE
jgi:hypothetical protein